jgi:hypothetical protein
MTICEKQTCNQFQDSYYPASQQRCTPSGRSSGVEHNLAKVRVVSSNLIARSKYQKARPFRWLGLFDSSLFSGFTRGQTCWTEVLPSKR